MAGSFVMLGKMIHAHCFLTTTYQVQYIFDFFRYWSHEMIYKCLPYWYFLISKYFSLVYSKRKLSIDMLKFIKKTSEEYLFNTFQTPFINFVINGRDLDSPWFPFQFHHRYLYIIEMFPEMSQCLHWILTLASAEYKNAPPGSERRLLSLNSILTLYRHVLFPRFFVLVWRT